jgi:predicted dinucleotide-utilizing enzyme
MVSEPALSLKFQAKIEVAKSGDLAYTQGSYIMVMADPQIKEVIHDHGS